LILNTGRIVALPVDYNVNLGQKLNMTSSVVYNGGLRTTCTHIKSEADFETDAPEDNHGLGQRFSPTDLLATSLAACMLTVMGIKARTMGFDLDDIKVEVLKKMKADPRRVSGIDLTFHIPAALLSIDEKTKAIMRNTGDTCPVMKSIHPDIEVNVDYGGWALKNENV
jgi:putative redox protein